MGAVLVLVLVALGALATGVLIGRYYVPDDRQLRRTARHSRAYVRALASLIGRDTIGAIGELREVVEENVEDVEPYFVLGALFRSRGEHERAIRVHQALAVRERDHKRLRARALYELGLDFRAAAMPRRASSIAMLAWVSFERWKPGTTTTSGAGFSSVAESGRKRSAWSHWPFWVGSVKPVTRTVPPAVDVPAFTPAVRISSV